MTQRLAEGFGSFLVGGGGGAPPDVGQCWRPTIFDRVRHRSEASMVFGKLVQGKSLLENWSKGKLVTQNSDHAMN
jgi:hypothetical protein